MERVPGQGMQRGRMADQGQKEAEKGASNARRRRADRDAVRPEPGQTPLRSSLKPRTPKLYPARGRSIGARGSAKEADAFDRAERQKRDDNEYMAKRR